MKWLFIIWMVYILGVVSGIALGHILRKFKEDERVYADLEDNIDDN